MATPFLGTRESPDQVQARLAREEAARVAAGAASFSAGGPWDLTKPGIQENLDAYHAQAYAQTPEGIEAARQAAFNATPQGQANQRYGTDLSWLDPSFQVKPALLGQSQGSQTYGDPNSIAAQQAALNGFSGMVGKDMGYASSAQQQGMFNQLGAVAAGQGAPQFMGNTTQQGLMSQAAGLGDPQFGNAAQQNQVFDAANRLAAPQFDQSNQQQGVINDINNMSPAFWQNADRQQNVFGQVETMQGPQFGTDAAQQAALGKIQGLQGPQFGTDTDQRNVFNSITGLGTAQDATRQNQQYANLDEIIQGGGATALEMANRQAQRADQEQWLRSQRDAQKQDYESRGMSGSGQELLALGADRQAAAGRNSLADLQTAAQLEQRRLDTIGQAGQLATGMRGQALQEQMARGDMANALRQSAYQEGMGKSQMDISRLGLEGDMANQLRQAAYQEGMGKTQAQLSQYGLQADIANRLRADQFNEQAFEQQNALAKAGLKGDMANAIRNSTYQEQAFNANNELAKLGLQGDMANQIRQSAYQEGAFNANYGLDKVNSQANIANQMRSQDFAEKGYTDQRMLTALAQQTALANQLRSDQFNESNATRGYDLQALGGQANVANNMRAAGTQEAQFRANSADQFAQLNQQAYNTANAGNAQFLQSSYQQMMNNRQDWEKYVLNQGIDVAQGLYDQDQAAARYGYTQGTQLATNDTSNWNQANNQFANLTSGANSQFNAGVANANITQDQQYMDALAGVGAFADSVVQASGGGPGKGQPAKKTPGQVGEGTANRPNPYGEDPTKRFY